LEEFDLGKPKSAKGWYKQGCRLENEGNHEEAIRSLDQAIMMDPSCVDAWIEKRPFLKRRVTMIKL
jgi:tetratricopeptide (TPR) repeat protein